MKIFAQTFLVGAMVLFGSFRADAAPQRLVSAGGDLTEIVYALGAADSLVGVDSTSNYPATTKDIAQIGYVRRVSPEGVLSLKPDMVLGAYDMGPPAAIEQLRAAGVQVELAPEGNSAEGVPDKIRFVGKLLDRTNQAEKLANQIEADLNREAEKVAQLKSKPRVIFVLAMGTGGPMVGGNGSSAESIITLAGGINAASGFEGYKPMSREAILSAQPDVLLMMNSSIERFGGIEKILSMPEFSLTPAGLNKRYVEMDGMLLLGFGPRTPAAVAQLSRALHP